MIYLCQPIGVFYFNQLGGFMSKIADYFKGVKKRKLLELNGLVKRIY